MSDRICETIVVGSRLRSIQDILRNCARVFVTDRGGSGHLDSASSKKRDWVTHFRTMYVHGLMAAQKGRGKIRKRSLRKHSLLRRRRRNNNSQNTRRGDTAALLALSINTGGGGGDGRRYICKQRRNGFAIQPDPTRGAGFPK